MLFIGHFVIDFRILYYANFLLLLLLFSFLLTLLVYTAT